MGHTEARKENSSPKLNLAKRKSVSPFLALLRDRPPILDTKLLPSFPSVAATEILAKHILNSALQKSFIYLDTTLGWPCKLDSSAHNLQLAGKKSEYDY